MRRSTGGRPHEWITLDSAEHAHAPLIRDWMMMGSVNGRAISRGYLKSDDLHVMRSDHFRRGTRTGEALEIVRRHPVRGVVRADPSVEVLATGGRLRLRVTPGAACVTTECEVSLG
ncbi:hypothetical protein [Streptomyces sporangiiformans]|uniref:Uncharacterized protein n=1 Tax=Streptomyces sporangiiformans TaxID=2315329 RepID=A0A505DC07_9ACTN|nr:hypothetical protein [Streptomyces sporangiiformans]TPQ21314.1 hypothetical protein FGD71_015650 [Streptomyces sporangiiformans]